MKLTVYYFLIFNLFLHCTLFGQNKTDFFAEIGNKKSNSRMHLLEEKKPSLLPEKYLPLEKGRSAAFVEVKEMSTKKELYAELDKLRNRYIPFMRDVAPELKNYRERTYLKRFKWRLETAEDRKDFTLPLKGTGEWKDVEIPHFGPPKGRATAYYFKEQVLTEKMLTGKAIFICFKGVDYKAHVFVNGSYVGSHDKVCEAGKERTACKS